MAHKILAMIAFLVASGLLAGCAPAPRPVATELVPPPTAPASQDQSNSSAAAGNAEAAIREASAVAQGAILACETGTQNCVADALDLYAATLANLAPQLPPEMHSLPTIVATAAKKVRAAKTRGEATRAIKSAIAQVHKVILLLNADDTPVREAGVREGTLVVDTLQTADNRLEKAAGL
jgi:hypothetical protein